MSMNDSIGRVTSIMPKFNEYLLRDYRTEQVNRFPEFIATIFKEAAKLFGGNLTYKGSRTMSPLERLEYSLNHPHIKGRISIQQNEASLVEFQFEYSDANTQPTTISVPLYVPYLHENALVINDTRFYMHLAIIEKMIYHIPDGVIIKVMRSPLQFWRNQQRILETTDGDRYYDIVITMRAHFRKKAPKKGQRIPLILYLLSRYDFNQVLGFLGLPPGSIDFVSSVPSAESRDPETDKYKYFKCNNNLYIKVDKDVVLSESSHNPPRRVLVSLLYIMQMDKIARNSADVSIVKQHGFYCGILGRSLYAKVESKPLLAIEHATAHLESLSTYLDQYTKKELAALGIHCNDIFDLLIHVFTSIDEWSAWYSVNDLFTKRIGGTELLLIEVVKQVFNRFYDTQRKHKAAHIKLEHVKKLLRLPPYCIMTNCVRVQSMRSNNDMYNDNDLLCNLIKKIRQSSNQNGSKNGNVITDKEHRFHPSFVAVESALALSQSSPGVSGDINPYVSINSNGYFQPGSMPWYSAIEGLQKYLNKV